MNYLVQLGIVQPPKVDFEALQKLAAARRKWPLWLRSLKIISRTSDRGLGDIVARLIGPHLGRMIKLSIRQASGKPCKCSVRQRRWNMKYPL